MKYSICFISTAMFILSFIVEIKAQTAEEIKNRINIEIRETHILVVQLLQTEIEGTISNSGELMRSYIHGEDRIIALSVIQTHKSLEQIKVDAQNALNKVEPDALKREQGIPWSSHPTNSNEKWTYWIFTDPISEAKFYFEIIYKIQEKEIIFTSYLFDF